jgi:hypothetical protein
MRSNLAACTSALMIVATPAAQDRPPDLSGRWQLVQPTAAERARDTLDIVSPDQILITQTPLVMTVEHPSTPGTHPEAQTFKIGVGGVMGSIGIPGRGNTTEEQWSVTHIGTQLMISRTTIYPPDEQPRRKSVTRGSMWRLETPNRLVIEFGEERPGERPKIATRVYVKLLQR